MNRVTLDELVERAKPYSTWNVPLDSQLRRITQVSIAAVGAGIPVGLFCVPALLGMVYAGWPGSFLGGVAEWLLAGLASPGGIVANGLALLVYGWLWFATHGLEAGQLIWHRVACGLAVLGAMNVVAITLPLALIVTNVVVVVAVGAFIIAVALGVLLGMLGIR